MIQKPSPIDDWAMHPDHTGRLGPNIMQSDPLSRPDPTWHSVFAAALIAATSIGSGGSLPLFVADSGRTGFTSVRHEDASAARLADSSPVLSTPERLGLLRRWLSLSVAEAARILGVQRPTIYAWERGRIPHERNQERLAQLYSLARTWRSLSSEAVGNLRKQVSTDQGETLVNLLEKDPLPRGEIVGVFGRLAEQLEATRAARPSSAAELAKRFGFAPLDDFEGNVDLESNGPVRG